MRILDRYVVRELAGPFLMGVGGFVVLLVGDILYVLAEYLARGQVPLWALVRLLFLKMPHILVITFPVSTLFGTLLGVGRLAREHEVTALRMAGLPLTRIFLPVLAFAAVVSLVSYAVNEYVTPWANRQADRLVRYAIFPGRIPEVRENLFFRVPGERYVYVRQADPRSRTLYGVVVYELGGAFPRLLTAKRGIYGEGTWLLHEGVVRELDQNGFTVYETAFEQMTLQVPVDLGSTVLDLRTPDQMSAAELREHLDQLQRSGVDTRAAMVEYFFKFAAPAAVVVFAFLAAPLALQASRGGQYTGVGVAILLVFLYYVVMSTSRAWGRAGALHPFLAAWMANLLFCAGGIVGYLKAEGLLLPARELVTRRALPSQRPA